MTSSHAHSGSPEPYLSCIPATLVSTLSALKLQPKLETLLNSYLTECSSASGEDRKEVAFAALEKKARPILLDVGTGKKGTAEILEKWKALPVEPAASAQPSEESHSVPSLTSGGAAIRAQEDDQPQEHAKQDESGSASIEGKAPKVVKENGAHKMTARERRLAKAAVTSSAASCDQTEHSNAATTTSPTSKESPVSKLVDASSVQAHAPGLTIHATSQETRFYLDAIETASGEIDLKNVTISIGEGGQKDLLVDAHLRLKGGTHYGLVGRNGVGKSTLLRAMADRIIPGLPTNYKILLVSQVENELVAFEGEEDEQGKSSAAPISTVQAVLAGDRQRTRALTEAKSLSKALDTDTDAAISRAVASIVLARRRDELAEAKRISLRRSGARGLEARKALIAAEQALDSAEKTYARVFGLDAKAVGADANANAVAGAAAAAADTSAGAGADVQRDWRGEAAELFAAAQVALEEYEADTAEARCESILKGLGFSNEQLHAPYMSLSGGWKSRASLASALLKPCECLVLDECTNFLDLPSVVWLQGWLKASEKTMVVISHDREFIDHVAEELIILRKQQLTYYDGNLSSYEQTQRRKLKNALKQQAALDRKREQVEKSIADAAKQARKTGDDNKMRMVKTRQKKLDERWGLERNSKGHRFRLNAIENAGYALTLRDGIDIDVPDADINFSFPDPERLRFPGALVHLDHVTLSYPGARRATVDDVTLTIGQGERVALIGPNGHGKTTITKLILEHISPTTGRVERHSKATIGLYEQHTIERFATMRAEKGKPPITALSYFLSRIANIEAGEGASMDGPARRFLGSLGLRGRTADAQPLHTLSGGQLVRLGLAELMWAAPDLICLDEVTQHLDSDSIDALMRALKRYTGAILLISHDRHAVKQLIEGKKSDLVLGSDGEENESSNDSDDHAGASSREHGSVYLVKKGKTTLLGGGMDSYTAEVQQEMDA
ncbi:P-loop containing nucleoside triphosphate hydrolase protein [Tilletiaria anomala UBC 951]|uniref:p-loop containing nucleoside triphosphate hydrolase protein n=1 Tax=Tilletiaria anomala (strain ATCC 24038 / CBS 436.72 / UBC 951) TaxID=1037660 RepID=A0A066VR44_TILAU|nr:P-loop containing nucleoside triphosphate hydrolase protein [Tilletiaria anomala UBC 951]KDN43911.1 P-loop containing nucleoside triphosphate hydrolase protein [Tilletiaria anomala UBC 951]